MPSDASKQGTHLSSGEPPDPTDSLLADPRNANRKRRILIASLSYGEAMGGAALSAMMVAQLLEADYEVCVLTGSSSVAKANVHELRIGTLRAAVPMMLRIPVRLLGLTAQTEKVVREFQPELIHLQDADMVDPLVPVARRHGIPVLVSLRDVRYVNRREREPAHSPEETEMPRWQRASAFLELVELRRPITWMLPFMLPWLYAKPARVRELLSKATLLLPISQFLESEVRGHGIQTPSRVLRLVPTQEWTLLPPSQGRGDRFLSVGRLVKGKGFVTLLRSFAKVRERLPNAELNIIGDGPQKRNLEKLRDSLGCRTSVHFEGKIQQGTLKKHYERSDIVVFPSIFPEGLGRVVVDAISLGRPVIASRVGGVPEIVGEDGGVLVPPGDEDALAAAMIALAQDPSRRAEIVAAAKARAAAFTLPSLYLQLSQIYEHVLREGTYRNP